MSFLRCGSNIGLARNGNSGCANEIFGCAKCHFWRKSPWKWKNWGNFRVCNLALLPVQNTGAQVAGLYYGVPYDGTILHDRSYNGYVSNLFKLLRAAPEISPDKPEWRVGLIRDARYVVRPLTFHDKSWLQLHSELNSSYLSFHWKSVPITCRPVYFFLPVNSAAQNTLTST